MLVNRVTLIGYLGDDPDIKVTSDSTVCRLSLATSEQFISGTQQIRRTDWHNIVTFGRLAQRCALKLKRGSHIFVEGSLRNDRYTDKNGLKHFRSKIHATYVYSLDGRDLDDEQELKIFERD